MTQPPKPPGRNDPCWCGSGKKYKHCHQRSDDARRGEIAMHQRISALVSAFADRQEFRAELEKAADAFLPPPRELDEMDVDERDASHAVDYFYYDYRLPGGERLIERFAREQGRRLARDERAMVDAWTASYATTFEVVDVTPGTGMRLRDLCTDEIVEVVEHTGSRQMARWWIIYARLMHIGNQYELWGVPLALRSHFREPVRRKVREEWDAYRERHPDGTYAECMRDMAPAIHRFLLDMQQEAAQALPVAETPEGDTITFCNAIFQVNDLARARAALSAGPEFVPVGDDPHEIAFTWQEAGESLDYLRRHGLYFDSKAAMGAEMGGVRNLGHLWLEGNELQLETLSWRRNNAGRALLETRLGDAITFVEATSRTLADSLEDDLDSEEALEPFAAEPLGLPDADLAPEAQALIVQMREQYEREWPDTRVPALGDRTPREAVQTFGGRLAVMRLLKGFETAADGALEGGTRPAVLFAALGIDEQELLDESLVEERISQALDVIAQHVQEGRFDEALAQWGAFRRRFPYRGDAGLHFSGDLDVAEALSDEIAGDLAQGLASHQRYDDAFAVIEDCRSMGVDEVACDSARADILMERGEDAAAERLLRAVTERHPADVRAVLPLASLYALNLREPDRAIALYRKALEHADDELDRFTLARELVLRYLDAGRVDDAERLWHESNDALAPAERDHAQLAHIQMAHGDWKGARASAHRAMAMIGGDLLTGMVESRAGNLKAARAAWGAWADLGGAEEGSLWIASEFALRLRDFQRVIAALTPHVAANPALYLRLALALAGVGAMDEGRKMAEAGRAGLERADGRMHALHLVDDYRRLARDLGLDAALDWLQ